MRIGTIGLLLIVLYSVNTTAQQPRKGLRGDSAAIADARAMVNAMGGMEIWAQIKSLHFVHEWFPWQRLDSYVENEILDLTGSRSSAERKSEVDYMKRVYSPESKYWVIKNGKFTLADDEQFNTSMARAPFNFYRLVRAVAVDDPFYEIRFGEGDIPGTRRLEFYGPDGKIGGWVILNSRKEPIVKATPDYRYTLGPLKRFGNLYVPAWGVYDNGTTRFEMISLVGDNQPPDASVFQPPSGIKEKK